MINVRRTAETDYSSLPWRAELCLDGTLAEFVWPLSGPLGDQHRVVVAYAGSPDDAVNKCYLDVGRRACLNLLPDKLTT